MFLKKDRPTFFEKMVEKSENFGKINKKQLKNQLLYLTYEGLILKYKVNTIVIVCNRCTLPMRD